MDSPAQNLSSPSVICVVDPRQRVFFFPLELCKTFLVSHIFLLLINLSWSNVFYKTMRHNVKEHCLSAKCKEPYERQYRRYHSARNDYGPPVRIIEKCEPHEPQHDFDLLTTDMKVIQAEDWPRVTTSPTSAIVRIHVKLVSPTPPKRHRKERFSKGYDETSRVYIAPGDERRFEAQEYSSPYSRIVINRSHERIVRRPTGITPAIPDLYIPPPAAKPTSLKIDPTSHQKDKSHETQDSGDKPYPTRRGVKFDSLRGESLVFTDQSTVERKPTINTGFPPVFTWPVTKRPSGASENINCQIKNSSIESPDPESGKNVHPLLQETEAQYTHEDIIKHVSTHIDGELRESIRGTSRLIYQDATEFSFFEVEKAIVERLGVSISFTVIAGVGKEKGASDLPPWKTTLKEVVSSLCRLFNFFVPLAYPCVVGDKFWGAIHDLITVCTNFTLPTWQPCVKNFLRRIILNHPNYR